MSKPSYATYITERLTGFSGEFRGHAAQDLLDYRDFARRQVEIGAVVPNAGGACCRGAVAVKSLGGLQADLAGCIHECGFPGRHRHVSEKRVLPG
jgi:5-methyltetrahydropteroyltriglutamate--homocysteine methyltransferase